jgi:hypothetical protein
MKNLSNSSKILIWNKANNSKLASKHERYDKETPPVKAIFRRGIILSQILICLYIYLPCQARTSNFGMLKSMINNRQNEAKVYIPDRALIGSKIDIIVDAPGAQKIILFQSNSAESSDYEGTELKVGGDKMIVGESPLSSANFVIDIPIEEYTSLVGKDIFFDAIAEYKTDFGVERKKATFFGANAAYSNQNAVRVIAPKKSTAGTEAMIRSIAPGLLNKPAQF